MDDEIRRWLKVFEAFDQEQKKEAVEALNDLLSENPKVRKRLYEEIGLVMGPLSGRCPYCGK